MALSVALSVLARIGRDDNAIGHCGMGALASRVAEQGVADDTGELSVRVDLQQGVADARCRAGQRGQGHGRLEIRELQASTELNEFLAGKWTGVAQVFRLVRTLTKKGKTSEEVVYGLTALSPVQAGAPDLLAFVRQHWAIGAIRFAETSEKLGDGEQGDETILDN